MNEVPLYSDPRGVGVAYERGTPAAMPPAEGLHFIRTQTPGRLNCEGEAGLSTVWTPLLAWSAAN